MPRSAAHSAWALAALFIAALTALRIWAIVATPLDLYTDEAQYWQWGRDLDFGYYSKPPLIGWLIAAVTGLFGTSDVAVRLPAPLLHAATAILLGLLGAKLYAPRLGALVAAAYVCTPMTAVGGFLISTDTVAFPFVAGALLLWLPTPASNGRAFAAGLLLGLGAMAKYAALYPVAGLVIAAALGIARPGWTRAAPGLAGALLALAPNLIWNATNGFVTAQHTADNADWGGAPPGLPGAATFLAEQLIVFGPVLLPALLLAPLLRPDAPTRLLTCLALPPILVVTAQGWLSEANANWAVMAYLPGTVAAVAVLTGWLRATSLAINAAICIALAAVWGAPTLLPEDIRESATARYASRAPVAEAILAAARAEGLRTVAAEERGLLADLFYHGRDAGLALRSRPYPGFPPHHYALVHPLRPADGPALFAGPRPPCAAEPIEPLEIASGAHRGTLPLWRVPAGCWP